VWGILSRIIAKITGLTLAAKHNREQGHSPLRLAEFSFWRSSPSGGVLLLGDEGDEHAKSFHIKR